MNARCLLAGIARFTSQGVMSLAVVSLSASGVGAQVLTRVGTVPGPVDMVKASGSYLYASAGKTLTVFDASEPAAIKRVGGYTFPEEIWSFRIVDRDVYVGTNFHGLAILDISTPASPVLRTVFKTPGQAKAAAPFGTKVIVVDHMEGLVLVDVSTPANPSKAGSFFVDGYARDVATVGPLAYAVDSPTGFYVLDLSRPGPLEPVATLQSGTALRTIDIAFAADGKTPRAAVLIGGGTVQLYDLANPRAPVKAGSLKTPGGALRVALTSTHAFVADAAQGVAVLDIATPSTPRLLSSHKTPLPARDVAVSGDIVFVAMSGPSGNGEILVLRLSR